MSQFNEQIELLKETFKDSNWELVFLDEVGYFLQLIRKGGKKNKNYLKTEVIDLMEQKGFILVSGREEQTHFKKEILEFEKE